MSKSPVLESLQDRIYFRAMNTQIEVNLGIQEALQHNNDAYDAVRDWFAYTESKFSRFVPNSELSLLNRAAGKLTFVSGTMLEVLQLARGFSQASKGMFNPLLLTAIEAAGYRRSFEELKQESLEGAEQRSLTLEDWMLDTGMRAVQIPKGAGLDLGGLVKGWAAERMSVWLQEKWHVPRGLINAGGDVVVWDNRQEAAPWQIAIANPWQIKEDLEIVALPNGAVATSSIVGRSWLTEQGRMHHLIDPRTMRSSCSDVVQCTIIGPSLAEAEVWAKVICMMGSGEGIPLLQHKASQYEAVVCTSGQRVHHYQRRDPHV
jgi:thiamine biosynthesis lipoprotein